MRICKERAQTTILPPPCVHEVAKMQPTRLFYHGVSQTGRCLSFKPKESIWICPSQTLPSNSQADFHDLLKPLTGCSVFKCCHLNIKHLHVFFCDVNSKVLKDRHFSCEDCDGTVSGGFDAASSQVGSPDGCRDVFASRFPLLS